MLVTSVEELRDEIEVLGEGASAMLRVHIFHPLAGVAEVEELWLYTSQIDEPLYAYRTSEGTMAPCNVGQPILGASLQRVFQFDTRR